VVDETIPSVAIVREMFELLSDEHDEGDFARWPDPFVWHDLALAECTEDITACITQDIIGTQRSKYLETGAEGKGSTETTRSGMG
jgi:hypothetical protein